MSQNPSFEQNYGFGDDTNIYIGAAGHFGNRNEVLKHYAGDMGFEYLRAETKEQVIENILAADSYSRNNTCILLDGVGHFAKVA